MKNKTLQIIEFIWIVALPLGVMILILVGDKSPLALKMLADIELFLKMIAAFLGGMVMTAYSIGWVYLIMSKLGLIKKTDDWLRWFFK
mgnify:FL=1